MANEIDYSINYDDERFQQVEADKTTALSEVEKTYGGMANESDKYYQAQIDASKEWAEKQTQLQNEQTDFAIKEINQQKEQAKKDYTKEQSASYVDWQKQSNQFGVNAEQAASMGMGGTGWSESSQVSMYNTYQNRVTTARESYNLAVQNYNNAITEARLQNNSALAEIAYTALQQQLELSLQGFQYKNQLLLEQANKKLEVENMYYNRYQDVLNQINTENTMAEEIRQFNEELARQKAKDQKEIELANAELGLKRDQLNEQKRQFDKLHGGDLKVKDDDPKVKGDQPEPNDSNIDKSSEILKELEKENSKTMRSILDLGYGPISAAELARLVRTGIVEEYRDKNGVQLFRDKNTTTGLF